MRTTTGAPLDDDAFRLWVRILDVRAVALTVVGLVSFFLPTTSGHRIVVASIFVLVLIPYSGALAVRVRRRHRLDAFMPVTDLALAALTALVVPETWPAVLAVSVADIGLSVVMFGRRTAIASTAVGAGILAIVATRLPNGGSTGVSGFVSAAALVIVTIGAVSVSEKELRERYTNLVNGIQGIVWEYDPALPRLSFVSEQVEQILGWTVEEALLRKTWLERVHPEDVGTGHVVHADGYDVHAVEFRVRHADGRWVWLRDVVTVARDEHGKVRSLRGISIDATEAHQASLELRQYGDIVEQIQFSLMVWRLEDPDDDHSITAVRSNPAATHLFSLPAEEALQRRLVDLWPGDAGERFAATIAATIRSGEKTTVQEVPFVRGDGSDGFFSVRIFPLPDRCAGLVCEDVTDQRVAADALRHQALHDSLTGLPNRALLQDRLSTALAAAHRTRQAVGLLVLDLNQFKEINDTLGHPMGDRMLEEVGSRLASVLRDCDTVARLGGDEFAVLLTVDATRAGAEGVAVRIRDALTVPFELMGVSVQTAASIGIVLSPDHGTDAGTLVQRADIAMYNAKRSGRAYSFYAAEDDHSSLRRLSLVGELRCALERDELLLHYQPQVDVASGRVIGVEALVRWQHPEHGLLPPAEFIELAEVSGIIQPLTRWVIRNAMAEAARFAAAGQPLVVSANVSARNLYDPELVRDLQEDLETFGVPPELFMLELTESEIVDDPSQVMTVLSRISDMGVRVAIDDFGTGWSSLANLTRLPIHQVKIDRSFVSEMLSGGDDSVIVRSVVDLGHNLGLVVVAEGVENAETLHALAVLGCDLAQGYHFSRPVPPDELLVWLRQREQLATAVLSSIP